MVSFNPDVKYSGDPYYLNLSKTPADIKGDTSTGVALKGAADVFSQAISTVDNTIKSYINDETRQQFETARDTETANLETVLGLPQQERYFQPETTPAESTPGDPLSLSPYNMDLSAQSKQYNVLPGATAAPVPSELQGQSVEHAVRPAMIGSQLKPRLQTYYQGNVAKIAKDLRSRFPSYADYIDQRISSLNGRDPANARLQALMNMVATSATNLDADRRAAIKHIWSKDYPDGDKLADKINTYGTWESMHPLEAVQNWQQPYQDIEYQHNKMKRQNETATWDESSSKRFNSREGPGLAAKIFSTNWKAHVTSPFGTTVEEINKYMMDATLSGQDIDPHVAYRTGQYLHQLGDVTQRQINAKLDSSGFTAAMGVEARDKISSSYAQNFHDLADRFSSKETGVAYDSLKHNEIILNQTNQWLLRDADPGLRRYMQLSMGISKLGGPAIQSVVSTLFYSGKFGNVDVAIQKFSQIEAMRMFQQTGGRNPPTLANVLKYMKDHGVGGTPGSLDKQDLADRQAFVWFTTDMPDFIANPGVSEEFRRTLAQNVFTGDVVGQFQDQDQKKTVLMNLTKDSIKEAVWKLGGSSAHSPLWLQYKNFVAEQSRQVLQVDASLLNTTRPDVVKLTYNPKTNTLASASVDQLNPASRFARNALTLTGLTGAVESSGMPVLLDRINAAIAPLAAIVEKERGNAPEAVLGALQNSGVDISRIKIVGADETPASDKNTAEKKKVSDTPFTDWLEGKPGSKASPPKASTSDFTTTFSPKSKDVPLPRSRPEGANEALSSKRTIRPGKVGDPVATDIPDVGRAFLNAFAIGESGGRYDVRYTPKGGKRFKGFDKHPNIREPGPEGPSSAAGRYQFTGSTWKELGGGSFKPAQQDHRAWSYAQDVYARITGRNLLNDLTTRGFTRDIAHALRNTWTSFRGKGALRAMREFRDSMRRYNTKVPMPRPRPDIGGGDLTGNFNEPAGMTQELSAASKSGKGSDLEGPYIPWSSLESGRQDRLYIDEYGHQNSLENDRILQRFQPQIDQLVDKLTESQVQSLEKYYGLKEGKLTDSERKSIKPLIDKAGEITKYMPDIKEKDNILNMYDWKGLLMDRVIKQWKHKGPRV